MKQYKTSFMTNSVYYVLILFLSWSCQGESSSQGNASNTSNASNNAHVSNHVVKEVDPKTTASDSNKDSITAHQAPVAIEDAKNTFQFIMQSHTTEQINLELKYHRRTQQVGARSMELFLEYPPHLQLQNYLPASSVQTAEKQLIIQNKEPGISRVIVYGINTKELASGTLFQFTLQGKRQSGDLLYIRDKFPLFAPAQANEGVVLGQPYALQVK